MLAESIWGTTNGVTEDALRYQQSRCNKGEYKGRCRFDQSAKPVMLEHLHSEGWINSAEYGEILFETQSINNVVKNGDQVTADVTGTFTLHGVSKEITAPVKFSYLPGKLQARNGGDVEGDLLVMRANFDINRSEFGIKPGQATDKVAEDIAVSFALVGYAAK